MLYRIVVLCLFAFLALAACAGVPPTTPGVPTTAVPIQTTVPTENTATAAPTLTAAPLLTMTASPTLHLTATETPKNSALATQGYDIADVRLSFPRQDMVVVDFKYRLDESRTSRDTYIVMTIPPDCRDDDNQNSPPNYVARSLVGEVRFEFKLTLEGECTADAIEFTFYPDPNRDANPPFYREYVLQPYRLVRNFPTVNSQTLKVENFKFTPASNWSGVFTFDYTIADEIPFPLEQYHFFVYGFGPNGSCPFEAEGPVVAQHSGEYRFALHLPENFMALYQECLGDGNKYTYTASYLALRDLVAGRTVYHQALNVPFAIFKDL